MLDNLKDQLEQTELKERELLSLADNMASAAASFSSHGYDSFICARDILKQAIHSLFTKVKT